MLRMGIYTCLISMLLGGSLKAQINTDRPDQTESSSTVPIRSLQIESGILIGNEGKHQTYARQMLLPTNLFRVGVSNKFELRLLSQYEKMSVDGEQAGGISDLEVGTKIQILKNENRKTEIAFLTHLIIPTGTSEISNGTFGTSSKLCISNPLGSRANLGYNIGYDYHGIGKGDLKYSLSFGYSINDMVGFYFEPYGEVVNFNEFRLNSDAGFTILAFENLQFDFSFGTGINRKMNYISAGCSWLLK